MEYCSKCGVQIKSTSHVCDFSKDQWRRNWHGGQQTSGYIAPVIPTIRDLFAIAAMQGILSTGDGLYCFGEEDLAKQCYKYANAMMAQRDK